jgi:GTP-binding protein HflX
MMRAIVVAYLLLALGAVGPASSFRGGPAGCSRLGTRTSSLFAKPRKVKRPRGSRADRHPDTSGDGSEHGKKGKENGWYEGGWDQMQTDVDPLEPEHVTLYSSEALDQAIEDEGGWDDDDDNLFAYGDSDDDSVDFSWESGGAWGGAGGGARPRSMDYVVDARERDLHDMLLERSLRFFDPSVTREREKAFLVGLEVRGYEGKPVEERERWADKFTLEESMSELSELAATAGLEVAGSSYQRVAEPNPRTYIGTGKVKEVKRAMSSLDCKTVIIDGELSPGQQRSLENEFGGEDAGIKVLDRTALVIDIFAQHAKTKEGQLQVELALLTYRLPRLTKLWTHLERQSAQGGKAGGVGLRGPGETQIEIDRRLIKSKIADLQKAIKGVERHRNLHRRRREKLGLPVVALCGYTNSGKSTTVSVFHFPPSFFYLSRNRLIQTSPCCVSQLNGLTRAGVLAEDMLFATLDPTTRRVKLPGLKVHPEIMVTDTVGFIQKLPTNLVAAFRATLEEAKEADVIVHVCDISNGAWQKQSKAALDVLGELGALDKPVVTLWNKLDLIPEQERESIQVAAAMDGSLTVAASSLTGEGMEDFIAVLEDALALLLYPVEAVVPYSRGDLLSRIHELGACDVEEHLPEGTLIEGRVPAEILNRLEPYYTKGFVARRNQERQKQLVGRKGETASQEEEIDWTAIAKGRHKLNSIL